MGEGNHNKLQLASAGIQASMQNAHFYKQEWCQHHLQLSSNSWKPRVERWGKPHCGSFTSGQFGGTVSKHFWKQIPLCCDVLICKKKTSSDLPSTKSSVHASQVTTCSSSMVWKRPCNWCFVTNICYIYMWQLRKQETALNWCWMFPTNFASGNCESATISIESQIKKKKENAAPSTKYKLSASICKTITPREWFNEQAA